MIDTELLVHLQQYTDYDHLAIVQYLESGLPSPLDQKYSQLCASYRQTNVESRCAASQFLDEDRAAWLNVYAYRMAMLAARQQSTEYLNDALTALLIIAHRDDRHNFMMTLSVVHHSATKLGSPDLMFRNVVEYACDAESVELLLGFLKRSPQDKRIEIMGFQEVLGQHGIIYARRNQETPVAWK